LTDKLRIALAQLNPRVGALQDNLELALGAVAEAEDAGADLIMFTELFLSGYFPEDMLCKKRFVDEVIETAHRFARATAGSHLSILLPSLWWAGDNLYNAVLLIEKGEIVSQRFKQKLPSDDVFYEQRYFTEGPLPEPFRILGVTVGVPVCEDIWSPHVCRALAERGAEILLCPNGSPYWRNKQQVRWDLVRRRIGETGLPLLYLNQVGGQDELVFDGASFGMDRHGELVFQGHSFETELVISDWAREDGHWDCTRGSHNNLVSPDEAPWRASVLGLRDYVRKTGFDKVVIGLSGGIDSAVTAAIAVDALGADNVHCIMLPYRYTTEESLRDARACAELLGVRYDIVPIGPPVEGALDGLSDIFAGMPPDIAEENIQSRMRGLILMAVSNKLGSMLVTTGNKSEMAVGYATIYGDMNGGFNPLKDMWKTQVYHLADWRNANMPGDCLGPEGTVIPDEIIHKAPSAELREDQTDQDSLPDYDELDRVLTALVEEEASVAEIVARGHDFDLVKKIEKLLYIAEYKRRQAAPGVKLTRKAFGIGRKYPIANGWRDAGDRAVE